MTNSLTNFKYYKIVLHVRLITGADYRTPSSDLLNKLGWSSLKEKRNKQNALMMFKIMNGMTPTYLEDIFARNVGRSVYNLRISRHNLALPAVKTDYYWNNFAYTGAKIWNALSDEMKCEKSMRTFKRKLESLNLSIYKLKVKGLSCIISFCYILL